MPLRCRVLPRPRRRAADLAVHLPWDGLDSAGVAGLLTWVRRCRAQGVTVHVHVVSPDAVWYALLRSMCATSMAMHVPVPCVPGEPEPAHSPDQLCRQLHLTGAGARVVSRARPSSVPFTPGLPVRGRPLRQ